MADWKETNKSTPCGCCGRSGWCSYSNKEDATTFYCMRPHKPEFTIPNGYKVIKETAEGGVIVALANDNKESNWTPTIRKQKPVRESRLQDWSPVQARLWCAVDKDEGERFAESIGVSYISLCVMGLGWHERSESWSFPMYDKDFNVIGIRLRKEDGSKFAIKGSRQGIFGIPNPMSTRMGEPILIAEGPTDTAALISVGFSCSLGRPSCKGGFEILSDMLPGHDVVIVSDGDDAGREGAAGLAEKLVRVADLVRIIEPPAKDIREWITKGGTKEAIEFLIDNAKDCGNGRKVPSSTS